jgi:hypothetical protein
VVGRGFINIYPDFSQLGYSHRPTGDASVAIFTPLRCVKEPLGGEIEMPRGSIRDELPARQWSRIFFSTGEPVSFPISLYEVKRALKTASLTLGLSADFTQEAN